MQARDLSSYWRTTEDLNDREYVYLEADGVRGLRSRRWKLICFEGESPELYDMQDDPREVNNLLGEAEYREIGEDLLRHLLDQMMGLSPESTFGTVD